ncbi:hypothetical protein SADUNF_Sadunf13G0059200 [Salix dunnii]|uniref:Uncharacterized protein n=1 Tax=Salix dunnii TaxID=1413687 RepID=A0A835JGN6_9ROSI|nr:hypothetical protein SADUNF_Sadunf13G0059200 [Salix dunnii]
MAASTSATDTNLELIKKVRSHEVAIAELSNLSSSRVSFFQPYLLLVSSFGSLFCLFLDYLITCAVVHQKNQNQNDIVIMEIAVYQKNGNLFFRTTVQKATASEQKLLDSAKSKLEG